MPSPDPSWVVVSDANVLINLMHAGRLDLLGSLPAFEFVVPDHVIAEITVPGQRQALHIALTRGALRQQSMTDPRELATYAGLRCIMGSGEAACLALAEARGWLIASDEKRRFRREVIARLGEGRLADFEKWLDRESTFLLSERSTLATVPAYAGEQGRRLRPLSSSDLASSKLPPLLTPSMRATLVVLLHGYLVCLGLQAS